MEIRRGLRVDWDLMTKYNGDVESNMAEIAWVGGSG